MRNEPIVIVGGGFAGLRAALDLDKRIDDLQTPIFFIDSSPYHYYTPTLFEIISKRVPRVIAIPFDTLLEGTNIRFIQERVVHVDTELKHVITERRRLKYGDLILALGSITRALESKKDEREDILTCHTLADILKVRNEIENCFARASQLPKATCHSHFLVIGGGPTGVEFAAGLRKFITKCATQYNLSPKGAHVTLVEAAPHILPQLDPGISRTVTNYLKKIDISVRTNTMMTWQGQKRLRMNREHVPTHTIIWTVGAKPHSLISSIKGLRHDNQGRILVDSCLQAIDCPRVWVAGDIGSVLDSGLADAAIAHGRHIALAITAVRGEKRIPPYIPQDYPLMLSLGNRYGIAASQERLLDGILVIWYKKYTILRYLLSILPFSLALRWWIEQGEVVREGETLCYRSPSGVKFGSRS